MNQINRLWYRARCLLAASVVVIAVTGCGGSGDASTGGTGTGGAGTTPPPAPPAPIPATSLSIEITGVAIASAPVVDFTVINQGGFAYTGLTTSDLRFNIAKLTPGTDGNPSTWQNYINQVSNGGMRGAQERNRAGYPLGELDDHGDGTYTYTFATDLAEAAADCPAPCTDADGNPLDVSYDPGLTHRVVIQLSHSSLDLPPLNAVYTFRPSDKATTGLFAREIVKTGNCNECHNQLRVHGSRIETQYCVMCHNPGTWDGNTGNTADFKVMIHKIHRGADLPSVAAGGTYVVGDDFSDVVFPQDIRNCTKCHDGNDQDTQQGGNWKTRLSIEACGSCHDDIDFSKDGSGDPPVDPDGHPGGIVSDNSTCLTCHDSGRPGGSVEESHYLAEPVARKKFKLNILKICGTDVDADPGPLCAPGSNPTVTFSITDPTSGDAKYDIAATPEITGSNLSFLVAWDTTDYNNTDGTGERPGRGASIDFDAAGFVDVGLTRTVTADFIIPDGTGPTGYTAMGSGAIAAQGRLAGDFDGDGIYNEDERSVGKERERIFVKSEVAYFRIDDAAVEARRQVVDNAKCNQCHEQVSFHGGSRNGEALVCVMCHNPNNTDVNDRPTDVGGGLDAAATLDNKREESVDFKRMIHGIHAGAQINYDGSEAHGFREQGLVIGGTSSHDYSNMRFPGILQDCETCHLPGTYELEGDWERPTQNGILASTTDSAPTSSDAASLALQILDPAIDLNISPTAAVCSSCHDSDIARAHMILPGGAVFDQTQGVITSTVVETCAICHGPGLFADAEAAHSAR